MGLLRLVLALSVVIAHTSPWFGFDFFGNGVMAVESFFIISGFYMALVLDTRYRGNLKNFYLNRFIRLYPLYLIMLSVYLLGSCGYWLVAGHPLGALAVWRETHHLGIMTLAAFGNATMLGCDILELLSRTTGITPPPGGLVFIGPTWSLSVEIIFYALVPLVMRLSVRMIAVVIAGALALRYLIYVQTGSEWSHWLYYFAPATWALFGLGIGGYFVWKHLRGKKWFSTSAQKHGWTCAVALSLFILCYDRLGWMAFQDWRYYLMFTLAVPFVFEGLKKDRADSAIAEWSYPLYLAHAVVLSLYAPFRHFIPDDLKVHVVLVASAVLVLLCLKIDAKIQKKFKRPTAPLISTARLPSP